MLHESRPVKHEQERREHHPDLKGHTKPLDKLSDWMSILERTHGHNDPSVLERIKESYRKQNVIKPEDVPESAFLLEQRIAREMGYGDVELTDEFKEQKREQIINDQINSLDKWVDYLTSQDAFVYPTWGKYWAFTSMLKMGKFEKTGDDEGREQARFATRTQDTVAPFPPLNPRALSMTISVMKQKVLEAEKAKSERDTIANTSTKLSDEQFKQLLSSESFAKIYTQFLIELPEYSREGLQETRGKWVKYPQNSEPDTLVQSLDGYPLEWCTANIDTARAQLQGGDFHVYYSIDKAGNPVIPRIAIRMEGENKIAEPPRGIATNQNLDPYVGEVLGTKLKDFGTEGEVYKKRASDMKHVTEIEEKIKTNKILNKQDLRFIYEVDSKIKGFGYQRDPRVEELRVGRDFNADTLIILECTQEQIAYTSMEINENTKAYLGKLEPGIFEIINQYKIEHIYISFPEGKIKKESITIGGKKWQQLDQEMAEKNINISDPAPDMLKSKDFETLENAEVGDYVRLRVRDLLSGDPTTDQLYAKANELGLDLCPAEVGPHYRLKYLDQPINEYNFIAMKQISDRDENPRVFVVYRHDDGLGLGGTWAPPNNTWDPELELLFRLRKSH